MYVHVRVFYITCSLTYLHIKTFVRIISLFKVDKHTKKKKKDINLEHREHLATTQNKKKKSIVLIKVN